MQISKYIPRASVMAVLAMTTLAAHAQEENMETILDVHHVLAYLVASFLISVFLMVFYNRIIYYREKDVTKASKQLIAQLSLIMDANKTDAWTYDIEKNYYTLLTDKGNSEKINIHIDDDRRQKVDGHDRQKRIGWR